MRQSVLEDAHDAETEAVNVDIERRLWLLYRVNVLVDLLMLHIEFRQLLDVVELELLAKGRPLRVFVGDAPRRGCDSDRSSGCPPTQPRIVPAMQRRHWRRLQRCCVGYMVSHIRRTSGARRRMGTGTP